MSLTIFGISKSDFQRYQKKIPLLVRTFRSDLSTDFEKDSEKLSQAIADGNGILSIAVLRW